ncbi:hypothetical protein Lal_00013351 [Lupinus albus]|nr:hypothetical protein Lal_00013351 [Lupinus albus]
MAERRPKRVKTIANRPRRTFEEGGPSFATPCRTAGKRDPFFAPALQASRLARFHGRKLAYVHYADVYITMVKGKLIVLDEELFLAVGDLSSSGELLGNCENEQWDNFEALVTYRSYLKDTISVTPGGLTKVGALTVENRLLHYVIAYMLVQRNTNHAQPTTNDLKMIFAIKNRIPINWSVEILRVISRIASTPCRLLPYGIFISRIIDHMEIDTSDVEIKLTNTHDH